VRGSQDLLAPGHHTTISGLEAAQTWSLSLYAHRAAVGDGCTAAVGTFAGLLQARVGRARHGFQCLAHRCVTFDESAGNGAGKTTKLLW